jgi:hypothetical protein
MITTKIEPKRQQPLIPMVGAIVTAALLLSGVFLISSYQQPAIAQGNMIGGGGGGSGDGDITTTDNTTSTTMGGAAQGGNATNATGAGGAINQSTSEVRMNIEQARMALQNNDTQSAIMYLDMALSALGGEEGAGTQGGVGGNMTSTTGRGATNATTSGTEGDGPLEGIFGGGGC